MNVMENGHSLVHIKTPVHDCHFMNGMYRGKNETPPMYAIEKAEVKNVTQQNWVKVP